MEIHNHQALEYKDIVLKHKKSILTSRSEADITAELGNHAFACPVVAANMRSILTPEIIEIFDSRNWFYVYPRSYDPAEIARFVAYANNDLNVVSISIGVTTEWLALLKAIKLYGYRVDYFTVDVSLSWNDNILPVVEYIKTNFPKSFLIVGNGAEPDWVEWLESYGVDAAKVGLANGSVCSTYNATGIRSTLGSLIDCVSAAKNIQIIADGGFRIDDRTGIINSGDFNKAIRFGADMCMSGSAWSRCVDSPAITDTYYGNASEVAKQSKKHVEGVGVEVQSNGMTISETMDYIEDSFRSSISFFGGNDMSSLKTADFIDMRH